MSVLAKITKGVLRAPERAFCVNHPVGAEQRAKPRGEGLRILQRGECSMEGDFVLRRQRLEAIQSERNSGRSHAAKAFGFCSAASVPWKAILCSACSVLRPSTNLPRNTVLSTSTGRKKFCCESIHREWSGDNPPAGCL